MESSPSYFIATHFDALLAQKLSRATLWLNVVKKGPLRGDLSRIDHENTSNLKTRPFILP